MRKGALPSKANVPSSMTTFVDMARTACAEDSLGAGRLVVAVSVSEEEVKS